ncbi:MAG: ethanolamine ammonia-lyase reactivating factor EutA [Candidatus Hodarchaeales archaeon]
MSYKEIKVDINQNIKNVVFIVSKLIEKLFPVDSEEIKEGFNVQYTTRIDYHKSEDSTDYLKLRRLITEFKPSLENVIEPGSEISQISEIMLKSFGAILGGARRQLTGELKRAGIGELHSKPIFKYFCAICEDCFDIPYEEEEKILNSENTLTLPSHHDQEMQIKIENVQPIGQTEKKIFFEEDDFSVTHLMNHKYGQQEYSSADFINVTSVGIDIGSSTSHLIFSKLMLMREVGFLNMTGRYLLVSRKILFESDIINTPLLNETTIDIESIISFIEKEYEKAGIEKEDVDTGAVIVTGETAKKKNADEIVRRVASETGKFVSATAGPNYESVLGIMGSGILDKSQVERKNLINIDLGGGTSNLAIASNGIITSTSCINVGGRLLGLEKDLTIWRMDTPTKKVMEYLGIKYSIGDKITTEDLNLLVKTFTNALIEVMQGPAKTKVAKMLMMTPDLDFSIPIDAYSLSGGVAEFFYDNQTLDIFEYRDIGVLLAQELRNQLEKEGIYLIEPENKIRATVIGAGAFSLTVSGTTCYVEKSVTLPINNIPVIPINLTKDFFSIEKTEMAIKQAIRSFDVDLSEDQMALYFDEPIYHVDGYLSELAKGIELGLKQQKIQTNDQSKPIILIFKTDLAKMLSIHIKRETQLTEKLIILDEIELEVGDWIDIGESLANRNVYPVTVKSLVFKKQV